MSSAAAGSQEGIRKRWIIWPRFRLWNTAPAESDAKEACINTASSCAPTDINTAATASPGSINDYRAGKYADVHIKSGTLSGSDTVSDSQQGGLQGQRHEYSLSSSFTSANCSGSTDIVDTSSINWLYGGSFPRGRTLSFELDEQRLPNSTRAPEVAITPPHNARYQSQLQINLLDAAATTSAGSSDQHTCVPGTLHQVDNHLPLAEPAISQHQDDQQEPASHCCTTVVPTPRLTSFSFEPPSLHPAVASSPFAMVAQRKSQSFGALPAHPVANGQGIEINNRALFRSATGNLQPIMSLQEQQQFLQNEWLLLQQKTQIQKQKQGSNSNPQQLASSGRACRFLPLQSEPSLADDSDIIDADAVRLDLQEDNVRSRRGGRKVTAEQVGLEDEKRGMQGMDNDRWVARRKFVLDSVWAAEGAE